MNALISIFDGDARVVESVTRPTMQGFARRHGYRFMIARPVRGLPAAWSRVRALREALNHYELAVWLDADAIIVDSTHDLDSALAEAWQGLAYDPRCGPSTWLWCLRACESAKQFLDRVWALRHQDFGRAWEQGAVHEVLQTTMDTPALLREPWCDRYGLRREGIRFAHASYNVGTWPQRAQYLRGEPIERTLVQPPFPKVKPCAGPHDGSSGVSAVLMAGGLLDRRLVSGDFLAWGIEGEGEQVTVWANESHCFLEITDGGNVRQFGTIPRDLADPSSTARVGWTTDCLHDHDGFIPRHIPGY